MAHDVLFERRESDALAGVGFRVRSGEVARNAVHVVARLYKGGAWCEPGEDLHTEAHSAVAKVWLAPLAYGNVQVEIGLQMRRGGKHADNGPRSTVERDGSS